VFLSIVVLALGADIVRHWHVWRSVIVFKGVLHVFHQFGQCGWAHSLSYDGAHWKNARYTLTPNLDRDPQYKYDACGCYDGSLTMDEGVNGGNPVILYSPCPSWPTVDPASTSSASANSSGSSAEQRPRSGQSSSDQPYMAVARPSDLDDPELRYWTKDSKNPVAFVGGATSDVGQLWRNGNRWDGLSDGRMFSSNDSSLHTFYPQRLAKGWPRGGSGGQWFVELPPSAPPGGAHGDDHADGTQSAAPSAATTHQGSYSGEAPTHLISTGNGQIYTAGKYEPSTETFTPTTENLLLDAGQLNGRNSYTWATLQCSAHGTVGGGGGGVRPPQRRCFTTAWLSPARAPRPAKAAAHSAAAFSPPNSALSIVREVFWDAGHQKLLVLPMPELALLRSSATLFSASSLRLAGGGKLLTLPLPPDTGDTIDLEAAFDVSVGATAPLSFGVSVLAKNHSLLGSAVITINCSAASSGNGSVRNCTASGGIAHPPPPPPGMAPPIVPPWPGSRMVSLSRMMPNVSLPGGSLSGDATVKSIAACQQSCDALPACQTWTAFCTQPNSHPLWEGCPSIRCTMKAAVEKTGCPVNTSAGSRPYISGAKVASEQRCSAQPHGFMAPRMEWSHGFALHGATAEHVSLRVLVDRSVVEVFIGGGLVAAVMPYQPPNISYTSVHLFSTLQPQLVRNVTVWEMSCGWNQTTNAV
jgi:sucrose-6-phosphate hydrolase SacC (GH32 family)